MSDNFPIDSIDGHNDGLSSPDEGVVVERRRSTPAKRQTPATAPQADVFSPALLWRVYCQWWKWVVPIGLVLSVAAGALVWKFHVPEYEAGALIMIQSNRPYIAFENGIESRDADRYVETQIELLRSGVVLSPVLGFPDVASLKEFRSANTSPLEHLQEHLNIMRVGQSELYHVSYVSPSPGEAATIVNKIVGEYLHMQKRDDVERSQLVIEKLEDERLVRSARVEQLRQRVVDLASAVTGKDPFGHGAVTDFSRALSPASSLQQSLNEVEVNIQVLDAELQALQEAPIVFKDHGSSPALLELEIANRGDVRSLESRIVAIAEEMAYIRSLPRPKIGQTWEDDPNYVRLQKNKAETETELEDLKTTLRDELQRIRQAQHAEEYQQSIAAKETQLRTLSTKRALLEEKLQSQLGELKSGGEQSAQLEFAKAELEREEKVFEMIAARKLALQTEMEAPARVSLKQAATPPSDAIQPIPIKYLLVACFASLLAPYALAVVREVSIRRICDAEHLVKESQLPVIGEVAQFPIRPVANSTQKLPLRQRREMFIFAESIDSLRTNLALREHVGSAEPVVLAVASSVSGEGKTSVASSLAASVAGATKKPTLVVDADLRRPDVAEVLGVAQSPGLSEVLAGKASLSDAISRVGETNTYVLPAGKHHVNPHHVSDGNQIEQLYEKLKTKFQTVIVDTPPILAASESLVYAQTADMVVVCTLNNVSRAKQVTEAVERLHATGANVVGAVLSGVPVRRYSRAYGYYDASRETEMIKS